MNNVKNSIWLNTERKESALIFGLYYEFYNEILYRGMFKFEETFNTFLNNTFINYISNKRNENLDYKTLFNGYIDNLLSILSNSNKNNLGFLMLSSDINLFKKALEDIDDVFPHINIINNLNLSYENKANLMLLVIDYSNGFYDTLDSFFEKEETNKLYELIVDNVYNYLSKSNNIDEYKKTFYENNRTFIDYLEKENILSLEKMDKSNDVNIDNLNKKERKLLLMFIKESLIYGNVEEINMFNLIKNSNMSKLSLYCNAKSLIKKMHKQEKTKKR